MEFFLVVIFSIFHPIEFFWEFKLRIKHKYLRQWENTWRFLRGDYKDEFDPIFDLDGLAMSMMSWRQKEKYVSKITRRRHYVHEKFLRKSE